MFGKKIDIDYNELVETLIKKKEIDIEAIKNLVERRLERKYEQRLNQECRGYYDDHLLYQEGNIFKYIRQQVVDRIAQDVIIKYKQKAVDTITMDEVFDAVKVEMAKKITNNLMTD